MGESTIDAFQAARVIFATLVLAVPDATAADDPQWAYPVTPPPGPYDATVRHHVPGSDKSFTQAEIEDDFSPPDWFPDDHPVLARIVAHGRPPAVKACAKCHVTNGMGHPESADLAGLPPAYLRRQIADFKSGARHGRRAVSMVPIADAISDEEIEAAVTYYAALTPVPWTRVVETATVPKSEVRTGGMRFPTTGEEPLGARIIELPEDAERAERRDSRTGFVAYVPTGSIAAGRRLVMTGDGRTTACAQCHGQSLGGANEVPRLAGRSPIYVFRQLNDMKQDTRDTPAAAPMRQVVARLSQADMLAIAAYLATLPPGPASIRTAP